ncbi:DNA mismatch repair endonuclease MutL [bacterium]|nr:MAG: DNA mismatch repair endonuclease MutL [bacterium]
MQIQKLSKELINKIAAGEVVERPASIVKELIENSIDAASSDIQVKVKNGGISEIRIIDNGSGIEESQIELAFQEHSTSKISSIDDLFSIHTNGFRGEALSSISAVSKVVIETRTASAKLATKCEITNGRIDSKNYSNRAVGTSITIADIFYNVPARRKFLKTIKTEENKIIEAFEHIAFVYPVIGFSLEIDGKMVYKLTAAQNNFHRVSDIFNLDKQKYIVKNFNNEKFDIDFILSKPSACVNRGAMQLLSVNNRFITDQVINTAVKNAYQGFVPQELKPQFVIHLQVKPETVDVNVHPRKLEVRWEDQREMFSIIYTTVRQILTNELKLDTQIKLDQGSIEKLNNTPFDLKSKSTSLTYSNKFGSHFGYSSSKQSSNLSTSLDNLHSLRQTNNDFYDSQFELSSMYSPSQSNIASTKYISAIQLLQTYILLEYSDKVLLIDQHAAAERITFDKLKRKFDGNQFESQRLLLPYKLDLDQKQKNLLTENLDKFLKFGISIENLNNEFVIQELPNFLTTKDLQNLVVESLSDLIDYKIVKLEEVYDRLMATIACHGSYRGGDKMSRFEIDELVLELFQTAKPYSCPHGRPVIWELTKYELEKKFGRVG